ncbi:MAG: S-layer homology domain-containing protein [Clostridiales bacterium]|nr:S-layer homology domain-containing protein [Clostridiales bacterium]
MKKLSKMLSVVLSLAMCAGMVMPALAVTYDMADGNVSIETREDGTIISWQRWHETYNSRETACEDSQITITQSPQSNWMYTVHVGENVKGADITLKDVSLTGGLSFGSGDMEGTGATIAIEKGSDVTIELDGENKLTASNGKAGLYVAEGASVTIKDDNGDGSLVATGGAGTKDGKNGGGAGIGGNGGSAAGDITITGGTVTAIGGNSTNNGYNGGGAGIGSGASKVNSTNGSVISNSSVGDITITGGTVNAMGGAGTGYNGSGAGIGSGANGTAGNINISGGEVTATGGNYGPTGIGALSGSGAGIGAGSGKGSHVDQITISGDETKVTATGGNHGAGIGSSYASSVDEINISGGEINATGGTYSAGIGAGRGGWFNDNTPELFDDSEVETIHISGGNVTAVGGKYGAGIGSGTGFGKDGSESKANTVNISGGTVTATGGASSAGIGTGWAGTTGDIEISGGNVTANGASKGAGIGTGNGGTANEIEISGGKVTANAGDYAAGIGSGWKGTATQIEVSGGDVTAIGGLYSAAIGAGYQGSFSAVSITGGDIVAQSGKWASAIGNDYYGTGGTIAIKGANSLIALGDSFFAVDTRSNTAGVEQTILNGRFLANADGLSKVNEVEFVIVDAKGNEVKHFTLKPQSETNMYETFAVNLPEGGTYYVFCQGDYDHSIAGYESDGKQVAYVISEGNMLTADLMQFPSFDVSYSFVSGTEGQELPESITAPATESGRKMTLDQLNGLIAGDGAYSDVKANGGTWHFDGWDVGKSAINDNGILTSAELVGTWSFTPDQPAPTPDPVTNPTVEIDDVDVPLSGIFTRADAIGYLWEQSGSPEWELSDFEDVPEDHYWAVAIGWAQDMGIALPDEDGNFRPDEPVLRSVEDLEIDPEGELQEFLNRYAVYAGIELDEGELFIELAGDPDDIIMAEEAQVIFDDFFAKLELALAQAA